MRTTICLTTLLLAPLAALRAADAPAEKPNLVVIFIDDLGYGDIGPFGATKQRTPNLDRMTQEGMKLTSFYSAPVCSVARAQLLTGCYGARVSVPGVYGPGGRNGLHPAESTIAERLKELGAGLVLDEFGVGYSSLAFLQRFPFDSVKINRTLVKQNDNPSRPVILRSVITLARDLGMDVVAEGAETESDAIELYQLGCGFAEGSAFGRPISSPEARRLVGATPEAA